MATLLALCGECRQADYGLSPLAGRTASGLYLSAAKFLPPGDPIGWNLGLAERSARPDSGGTPLASVFDQAAYRTKPASPRHAAEAAVYRTITLTVPPAATDGLARGLQELPGVVGLAVHRGASLKPPGDQLVVEALSTASDEVMARARAAAGDGPFSVTTAEATSLTDPSAQPLIDADRDEAVWEEMESRLLQEGSATPNFVALTAFGGAVALAGLVSEPVPQAIALVSASVIAPGFEPLAKFPLGVVLGRWGLAWKGLRSAAAGYLVLIAAAALTLWGLVAGGVISAEQFTGNPQVRRLTGISAVDLLVSAGGALAGMTMIAAFRHDVLPGALMALMLVPAAAMVGGAAALGRWDLAASGLGRAGIDVLLMVGAGLLVFGSKRASAHRRGSLRG